MGCRRCRQRWPVYTRGSEGVRNSTKDAEKTPPRRVNTTRRMRAVFDEEFEVELVATIQCTKKEMYSLSTRDVRRLAFNVALRWAKTLLSIRRQGWQDWAGCAISRSGIPHCPSGYQFPQVWPAIVASTGVPLNIFFTIFRDVLGAGSFTARSIWNCDKTGFTTVTRAGKVIATKGVRQVRKMSSAERGSKITALL